MISVENLLEKSEEESVIFTDFVHKVSEYGLSAVYCFIEDYDMPYYLNPLKYNIGGTPIPIRCRGKEKVIEIHDTIKSNPHYHKYTKRYFVDKDFDDNSLLDNDIYVTPGYSIENFYVTADCVRQIITTELDLDPVSDKDDYDRVFSMYIKTRDSYNKSILFFNAWYAALHEMKVSNLKIKLGLEFPKNWVKIKWNKECIQKYSIEDIEKRYPNAPKIDNSVLSKKKDSFEDNMESLLRGKYQIEFLFKFIEYLNEDGSNCKIYNKKSKTVVVRKDSAISQFCQYADVPQDLISYIRTGIYMKS